MESKFDRKKIIWTITNFTRTAVNKYYNNDSIFTYWFKIHLNGKMSDCRLKLFPDHDGCCRLEIRFLQAYTLGIESHVDLSFQLSDLSLDQICSFVANSQKPAHNFIRHEEIFNIENKYLHSNTLTIIADIEFRKIKRKKSEAINYPDSIYLNSTTFSDLTIVCRDNARIPAHRNILARSSVFKAMLDSKMTETYELEIMDIDGAVMLELLRFLYTGKVEKLDDQVPQIMYAANKYDLPRLKKICADTLIKQISLQSVLKLVILADHCNEENLADVCINFIRKNINQLQANNDWKQLSNEIMLKIINSQPVPILVFNDSLK